MIRKTANNLPKMEWLMYMMEPGYSKKRMINARGMQLIGDNGFNGSRVLDGISS